MFTENRLQQFGIISLILGATLTIFSFILRSVWGPNTVDFIVVPCVYTSGFLTIIIGTFLLVCSNGYSFESKAIKKRVTYLGIANIFFGPITVAIDIVGYILYCRIIGGCRSLFGF
jgi:hypothetical protein